VGFDHFKVELESLLWEHSKWTAASHNTVELCDRPGSLDCRGRREKRWEATKRTPVYHLLSPWYQHSQPYYPC
jgi:hypothetical protein